MTEPTLPKIIHAHHKVTTRGKGGGHDHDRDEAVVNEPILIHPLQGQAVRRSDVFSKPGVA